MGIASERAENIGAHLSGRKRQRCWTPGSASAVVVLKIRCFSVPVVESSAVMRLSAHGPRPSRFVHRGVAYWEAGSDKRVLIATGMPA